MALGYDTRSRTPSFITIGGQLLSESEKSFKAKLDNVVTPVWLPKSQCEYDEAGSGSFVIPMWLAKKEGYV